MAILNYTTDIPVDRTLGEIHALLRKAGARKIMTEYDDNAPTAVAFLIATTWGDRGFRLPANIDGIFGVLVREHPRARGHTARPTREQAARVGWRIIKDWLEAQLAFMQAEMVTLSQIMLPYMVVENDTTLYELMAQNNLMLPAGREEA